MNAYPLPQALGASAVRGRKRAAGVLLLAALAALAGCKSTMITGLTPNGGVIPGYDYTSPQTAPTPTSPTVLQLSFNGLVSFSPAVLAAASALLATAKYQLQNSSWYNTDGNGNQTGPVYSSFPLDSSGAVVAHALGLTGAGATVAVVDTHLNASHEVFAAKTITFSDTQSPGNTDLDHGTMVSSIIAGNSSGFIGMAPGANLLFGSFTSDQTLTAASIAATNANAVAQNNSWGYDTLDVGATSFNTLFGNASGQAYLSALQTYANQGVVVFATSNDTTKTHATIMEALPYVHPGLEAGWIAVANATPTFGSGGNVSSVVMQSSSCLEAARWCILADGTWTAATAASNTSYAFGAGTSFAAPQVSGALALLAEAFPTLSPHDLRVRLLASADNHFFTPDATVQLATGFNKGYSFTYGVGFLDVAAALLPIGASQMSLPGGVVQNVSKPIVQSGSAFGDAVSRSLSGVNIAFSDSLNAGFTKPADALIATAAPQPLGARLLAESLTADLTEKRIASYGAETDPFAGLTGRNYAMRDPASDIKASFLLPQSGDTSYGINIARALSDGPTRVEVGLKFAHDQGSLMGFGGTDGQAGADMISVRLNLSQDVGKTGFLTMGGEFGLANLGGQAALSNVSTARFNSLNLGVGTRAVFASDDRLSVGLSMPIAVTSGSAQMVLPVSGPSAFSRGGSFDTVNLDLAPSSRQMDLSLSYQRPLGDNAEMLFQLVHATNYGNQAGQSDNAAVMAIKYAF